MLQNTYGNKGLDTLFGPGRIPDFWTPIVKNIHVFVHPIKKPSQAQGFWAYIHASGCLLVRSFRKHNTQLASLSWPKPVCLWWFLHFQTHCTLPWSRVWQKSMTGRRFLDIHAYLNYKKSKRTLPLSRNRHVKLRNNYHRTLLSMYVCSKTLCLWQFLRFQHNPT